MERPRPPRGVELERSTVPPEHRAALDSLYEAAERAGKPFPAAERMARQLTQGLDLSSAVGLVVRLLDSRGGDMDIPEAIAGLKDELKRTVDERVDLGRRGHELRAKEHKLKKAVTALSKIEGTTGNPGTLGRKHERSECPWPGCEKLLAPQGRRYHFAKHERDSGMTLEQAQEQGGQVVPIRA